jgi:molybdopterin molybdotransferase
MDSRKVVGGKAAGPVFRYERGKKRLPEHEPVRENPIQHVTAVILAGGNSTRMKSNKAFLPISGELFIERIHRRLSTIFQHVILVTNTPELYRFLPCPTVSDIYPDMGSLAGIHAGLVNSDTAYIFAVACDMPYLNPGLIRLLVNGQDAIIPESEGGLEPLHAVYGKGVIPVIEDALSRGNRKIAECCYGMNTTIIPRGEVGKIDPEFISFRNINTPEDYFRLREETNNDRQEEALPAPETMLRRNVTDRGIKGMLQSISMEKALEILKSYAATVGIEDISIADSFERTLAEDIVAGFPLPPFRRSPLDGYALRASDTAGANGESPVPLLVTQTVYAGEVPAKPLLTGEATAVTTGAPLPRGSDTVIKFEDILREGDTIWIHSPLRAGENVVPQGEDIARGEKVLEAGTNITPAAVGLLASLGLEKVRVYKKPRVAIFSIGDELLEVGQTLMPGKIYNSNLYTLAAQVREAGGTAVPHGTIPDEKTAIALAIKRALAEYDMIITTGGASVGGKDLVREAIGFSGANTLFWKIGMKPGTPAVCGEKEGKLIVGLSGNPSAAMITFIMLVRPILRAMGGKKSGNLPEVNALMEESFEKRSKQRRLLRSVVTWENGAYHAVPAGIQSPGALKSMLLCNALIDIPAGHGPLQAGEEVKALLLPPEYCLQG